MLNLYHNEKRRSGGGEHRIVGRSVDLRSFALQSFARLVIASTQREHRFEAADLQDGAHARRTADDREPASMPLDSRQELHQDPDPGAAHPIDAAEIEEQGRRLRNDPRQHRFTRLRRPIQIQVSDESDHRALEARVGAARHIHGPLPFLHADEERRDPSSPPWPEAVE